MAFTIPEFPFEARIWRSGADVGGPPAVVAPCNVAFGRRVVTLSQGVGFDVDAAVAQLLFPRGTDVRDGTMAGGADVVEAPAGSGRFYLVNYVNDLGAGFANEHRFAVAEKALAWPAPLPPVFVPGP